ncbi:hypothetical protein [Streptomyces specialis]|uniref:hypothetical protein n=1 Tax=Streptomyces specialis TaxID=498367 RepID=UPI000B1187E0|nr:hypothetical protein [Streptomyces specialis]
MTAHVVDVRLARIDRGRWPTGSAASAVVFAACRTAVHLGFVRSCDLRWPPPDDPETGRSDVPARDTHVRAPLGTRWADIADVLTAAPAGSAREAEQRAAALRARFSGCLVAAVPVTGGGACAIAVRGGDDRFATLPSVPESGPRWEAFVSFLHAWVVAGRPLDVLLHADVRPFELRE